MKLSAVLAVLIGTLVLACSSAAPAPAEPTPNIDATVEARVAQERAVDATIEARAKELVAEQPTATPYPTFTPVPTATPSPKPTDTPVPQPTNTPKPAPTNTPTPRPPPTPELDATYYRLQGISYQEQWKHELAIESFDKAIELDPNMSRAYHGKCKSLAVEDDQYLNAIKDCNKAIELDRNQADYYASRYLAYHMLRLWQLSIQDLEKVLELDPSNDWAHQQLGSETVKFNGSLREIEQAKEDSNFFIPYGSNPSVEYFRYWGIGNNYLMTGQFVNSIEEYGKAIELIDMISSENKYTHQTWSQAKLYYNRSLSYHFVHEFDLSKKDAMKACELDGGSLCGWQGHIWIN